MGKYLFIFLAASYLPAQADVIDISSLPHAAKAEVIKIVSTEAIAKEIQATQKEKEEVIGVPDIEKEIQKVVEKTNLSIEEATNLVVSFLFWKNFGPIIVHFIAGMIFLVLAIILIAKRYSSFTNVHTTYDPERRDIFGKSIVLSKEVEPLGRHAAETLYFLTFLATIIWICIIFSY